MTTPPPSKPNRVRDRLKRKLIKAVLLAAAGIAMGELCPLLPPGGQIACHLASKIVSLFYAP